MIAIILMSHGIGSVWLFLAFLDDANAELNALNRYKKSQEIRVNIRGDLIKFIEFQSKIKKLSSSSQDFFCPLIT